MGLSGLYKTVLPYCLLVCSGRPTLGQAAIRLNQNQTEPEPLDPSRDFPPQTEYTEGDVVRSREAAMGDMRVECYAGYRADERPTRFTLRGHTFEIIEVEDRWYSPGAIYFRVRTEDGDYFVLRHDEPQDVWSVDAFRSARDRADLPEAGQVGWS